VICGVTLDAGALIAVDRGSRNVLAMLAVLRERGQLPVIPAAVIAQAWRSPTQRRLSDLLDAADIATTTRARAQCAGELLARTQTRDSVDAIVVVVAAERGDRILTSDPHDLQRLADDLPTIRISAI
jgi:hypothetical protein